MNTFELWARSFKFPGDQLWKLEGDGDSGLYATKSEYGPVGGNYYWTTPVYHVWDRGVWLCATECYSDAVAVWEGVKKESTEHEGEPGKQHP